MQKDFTSMAFYQVLKENLKNSDLLMITVLPHERQRWHTPTLILSRREDDCQGNNTWHRRWPSTGCLESTDGTEEVLRKRFVVFWRKFRTFSVSGGKWTTHSLMEPTNSLQETFVPSWQTNDTCNYWTGAEKPPTAQHGKHNSIR